MYKIVVAVIHTQLSFLLYLFIKYATYLFMEGLQKKICRNIWEGFNPTPTYLEPFNFSVEEESIIFSEADYAIFFLKPF